MADPDAQAVYLCEDRLSRWARAGRAVVVDGRMVVVEPEHDFTDLASARLFCTLTCLELGLPPVSVRLRQGERMSHYDPARGEIALASWGNARLVVLHELAHHSAHHATGHADHHSAGADHGPLFRAHLLALLRHTDLPRQADELARLFDRANLPITRISPAAPAARPGSPGQPPPAQRP
ncbi:hypothetical protein ACQCX5_06375 [Propionibacteriaceae bacterium G57]|uniref:hypothetical protein n=1 Tax=Aestuariimicrobium sp. G57 TaxID=3418485 RepID=UPI003DA73CA9